MAKWLNPEVQELNLAETASGNNKNKFELSNGAYGTPEYPRNKYGDEGKVMVVVGDGEDIPELDS